MVRGGPRFRRGRLRPATGVPSLSAPRRSARVGAAMIAAAACASALPALAPSPAVATLSPAATVFARMSEAQRVGQLFMVGTPATYASSATLSDITTLHIGNVMLTGRSYAGVDGPWRVTSALRARTTAAATSGVPLFVATDQEGGLVQVLHGSRISEIPSALAQGRYTQQALQRSATTWAGELRYAGVNMNLAPVMDTVPSPAAALSNPPIGRLDREFGYTPSWVASRGTAVVEGMLAGGVTPAIKHFPGLGRVTANTDTTSGVTDWATHRWDSYLYPFLAAIQVGHAPFVMMSTAYYANLDRANPAAFSPFIINTVLRRDLSFSGVVISDDLANAAQVSAWSPAARAVKFVDAGGDMVLTVNPAVLPEMYNAVLARAKADPAFHAKVDAAALKVLQAKQARGLIS